MILTKIDALFSIRRPAILIACATAALGFAATVAGQNYYAASGQTAVFGLTAGAKSGPAAIRGNALSRLEPGRLVISAVKGAIVVTLSSPPRSPADIAVYDMSGKLVFHKLGFSGLIFRLDTSRLASGIYHARVRIDGQNLSRRFAVSK